MYIRGVDVKFHSFLISTLDWGEWSASRPGRFSLGERASGRLIYGVGEPVWTFGRKSFPCRDSMGLEICRDLVNRGSACMWRSKHQDGRKNVALLSNCCLSIRRRYEMTSSWMDIAEQKSDHLAAGRDWWKTTLSIIVIDEDPEALGTGSYPHSGLQ